MKKSLWLLPSGSDQVGERHVHRQLPTAYMVYIWHIFKHYLLFYKIYHENYYVYKCQNI